MPFGPNCEYADFAACEKANQDKESPGGYCKALMDSTEAHCSKAEGTITPRTLVNTSSHDLLVVLRTLTRMKDPSKEEIRMWTHAELHRRGVFKGALEAIDFAPASLTVEQSTHRTKVQEWMKKPIIASTNSDESSNGNGLWVPIVKADAAQRFTLGVVYKASTKEDPEPDAHNEFTTKEELREAIWDYVRSGSRDVYLQHGLIPGIRFKKAGEWLEIVVWPIDATFSFSFANGTKEERMIPAGSAYLGVKWEQWAWPHVQSGKIRGFSFSGRAKREALQNAVRSAA